MTVARANNKITFTYLRTALFDSVSIETLTAASKIEKNGEILIDEYGLSDDELDVFNEFLKEANMNVSRVLLKMTSGVTTANTIDATSIVYSIKDKTTFNANVLPVLDEMIFQALKNFIIKEWFIKCQLGDLSKYYLEKYLGDINLIVRYSLQLRKPTVA